MSSVVDESSMSMRTKIPRVAASSTSASTSDLQSALSSSSPKPVSLIETFASSRSASIAASASW